MAQAPVEAPEGAEAPLEEDEMVEEATASVDPPVPRAGFVVSITKRGKHRKLHAVAICPMVPGLHYHEWVDHGDLLPPSTDYESVCGRCLPGGAQAPADVEETSGSASSSSDAEPAANRQRTV